MMKLSNFQMESLKAAPGFYLYYIIVTEYYYFQLIKNLLKMQ